MVRFALPNSRGAGSLDAPGSRPARSLDVKGVSRTLRPRRLWVPGRPPERPSEDPQHQVRRPRPRPRRRPSRGRKQTPVRGDATHSGDRPSLAAPFRPDAVVWRQGPGGTPAEYGRRRFLYSSGPAGPGAPSGRRSPLQPPGVSSQGTWPLALRLQVLRPARATGPGPRTPPSRRRRLSSSRVPQPRTLPLRRRPSGPEARPKSLTPFGHGRKAPPSSPSGTPPLILRSVAHPLVRWVFEDLDFDRGPVKGLAVHMGRRVGGRSPAA